jgi:hypothetical protein
VWNSAIHWSNCPSINCRSQKGGANVGQKQGRREIWPFIGLTAPPSTAAGREKGVQMSGKSEAGVGFYRISTGFLPGLAALFVTTESA